MMFLLGLLIGINAGCILALIFDWLGERRADRIMAEIDAKAKTEERHHGWSVSNTVEAIDGSTIEVK